MEYVLYVCDLLSGMTRKGNIQISIQHKRFVINLYKEYTSLKSRELEELPYFRVMSWQPF